MQIELILPENETRGWHSRLLARMREAGHSVSVQAAPSPRTPLLLDGLLGIERMLLFRKNSALLKRQAIASDSIELTPDLRIDLSGQPKCSAIPTFSISHKARQPLLETSISVAKGILPSVELKLNDDPYDIAHPMIDNRLALTRGLEDVLARTISLLLKGIERFRHNRPPSRHAEPITTASIHHGGGMTLAYHYGRRMVPKLIGAAHRRVTSHAYSHWCVGYRFIDGPGVAEKLDLSGEDWSIIPDDASRFYADPFPLVWNDRNFIFVEDYEYAKKKGVISVSEILPDGTATCPVPIIEEDYHLSYPNVFQHGGEIWMLPESGASHDLVLYRATNFPHEWERHSTLISKRELADPTLIDHNGRLWLFTAERDGAGSAADMMSVFFTESLDKPWTPHPANPIIIHRAGARPGGQIVNSGGRLLIPLQDGTDMYGGALGIGEITELTEDTIEISRAIPILPGGNWEYPKIHTLNRAGRLEVIDGIVR